MAQVKGQPKEKEPATSVTSVYLHVVEDVIQSVRDDFQSEGVDESVLVELRQILFVSVNDSFVVPGASRSSARRFELWELKMMQSGAIQGASQETTPPAPMKVINASTQVHDLNVPYEAAVDEYQTPTMDLLFPPTPQTMTPLAMTPLPMTPQIDLMTPQLDTPSPALTNTGEPIMYQYMPPGPSESMDGGGGLDIDTKLGRPAPYMQQPAPWMNQKPRGVDVNIDMNATYEEVQEDDELGNGQAPVTKDFFTLPTGKRKREDLSSGPYLSGNYIPQRDGAGDVPSHYQARAQELGTAEDGGWVSQRLAGRNPDPRLWKQERSDADTRFNFLVEAVSGSSHLPQCDGMGDEYDDGVAEEDYNEPGEEEPQPAADAVARVLKVEPVAGDSEGGEPPLNEDDDDEVDENDQGDEEPQTDHLVLAQFDKVTRSKNKWKCTLKDGIMHLNNKDMLFVKATGEFEF